VAEKVNAASPYDTLISINQDPNTLAENYFKTGNYDSAYSYFMKGAVLYFEKEEWPSYCRSLLGISKCDRKKGDISQAKLFLSKADSIYKVYKITDRFLFAEIEYIRALILYDDGQNQESINLISHFIKNWKINGTNNKRDTVLALFYNALGLNYRALGKLNNALEFYLKATDYKEFGSNVRDNELATYYNNVATVYMFKGDYDNSISYSLKALGIYESNPETHKVNLANIYVTLGAIYKQSGKYDTALVLYQKAILIYRSLYGSNYYGLGDVFVNIGNLYNQKGEWLQTIEYYNKAIQLIELSKTSNRSNLADIKYLTGLIYYYNRRYPEAKTKFEECINIREKYYPSYLANPYSALAKCYLMLNRPDEALQYFSLAIDARIKYVGSNHPDLAYDYLGLGTMLVYRNDSARGIDYMLKAYDIYVKNYGIRHPSTANVLTYMGDFYYSKGYYKNALNYYQQAFIAVSRNFNSTDIYFNPTIKESLSEIQLLKSLKGKAETLYNLYKQYRDSTQLLAASLATTHLAVDLIKYIRISYTDPESKITVTENYRGILINGLKASMELYNLTKNSEYFNMAFSFAELSKAAILQETMQDVDAKIVGNVPATYIEKEKEYSNSIYAYQQLITEENKKTDPDTGKIDIWKDKLFELKQNKTNITGELEKQYPSYYDLKYGQNVISVDDLLIKAGNNEAIIEYVVADSSIYIFAFNNEGQASVVVETADSSFNTNIENVIGGLYSTGVNYHSQTEFRNFTLSLHDLYEKLILPVSGLLNGKDVIIIPDGKLAYIPFEILLVHPPDSVNNYADLGYLLNEHAIGYSYSATLLFKNRIHKGKPGTKLAAFAPNYAFNKINDTLDKNSVPSRDTLMNLKYVQSEVSYISKLYRSDIFMNTAADEAHFKSSAGNYRILHLAMHGLLDEANPMFSKLVFTYSHDSTEDGYLYTYEIYNLDLKADLAVLCACNTCSGKYVNGEGIMSMARGFYFAGCPGVVASRWSIYDKSSADITKRFYTYLSKGKSKIESLRLAKLDYLRSADPFKSHPQFWAAFECIGDPSPITQTGHHLRIIALSIIILVGISLGLYIIGKQRS
jgi:CHAT domain-containing protein/Tfp pilus assembly protein PilF